MTLPPDPLDQDMPDNSPDDVPDEALGEATSAPDGRRAREAAARAAGAAPTGVDELKSVLQAELSTDTTQHYLNRIGAKPLLSAQQEVALRDPGQGRRLRAPARK
jgi:RNA polymerase nonessential primary-like sigma factor